MTGCDHISHDADEPHSRLAPWGTSEADYGGRRYPEPQHPYRSCFQRDRDRIVHCSAFRRLDFKTQVFVPHEHDHFRTRLTHTLEVSQIARTIARAMKLNEDLAEAVALAHDLGHPPFGHAGEETLDRLMAEQGGFEHNRHSLRIVDYLEHPYPDFRGLNLSRVVRECLAKHETRYDTPICDEFDPNRQAVLEGQLVDLADEIAYTSADLDDALAAGWVSVNQLNELELWQEAWSLADFSGAGEVHKRIRACKAVLAAMVDDVLSTAGANIRELEIDSAESVQRAGKRAITFSEAMAEKVSKAQSFLIANVYHHPDSVSHHKLADKTISELFGAYVSKPELLPERYHRRIAGDSLHRVVCDYIAGMTDRFCTEQHAKLCG